MTAGNRAPALRLAAMNGAPLKHRPPPKKSKPQRPNPRTMLLRKLREQQRQIAGRSHYTRADAPDLFELAEAADAVRRGRRTVDFRGVRFPLKFGFRRYVMDPDTGQTLIGGGFLA